MILIMKLVFLIFDSVSIFGIMKLIDYEAYNPRQEIELAFTRAPICGEVNTWENRSVCLLYVGVHAAGIVIKPIYYVAKAAMISLALFLYSALLIPNASDEDLERIGRGRIDLASYKENPELFTEQFKMSFFIATCAFAAPLSQIIQLVKAAAGIIYPAAYFTEDRLVPLMDELARIAGEVGCSPALVEKLKAETIYDSLESFPNREYFEGQYMRDFALIVEKFNDPNFSNERKLALLSLLNPEPEGSGIEACPAGLGRILLQICGEINLPTDQTKVIAHLTQQYKEEIICQMVIQANVTKGDPNRPDWHAMIHRLAHDLTHRGNGIIVAIGEQIGLSKETLERAKKDPLSKSNLTQEQIAQLLAAFEEAYVEEERINSVQAKINSQPDGSPGLKNFRDFVIQRLSESLLEEEDPALESVRRYTLNGGEGDPSDEGFNNINQQAITQLEQVLA